MASEKRALQPLTEEDFDAVLALLARAHHHGQLLQSPPAKKKQNRAASPTPAATTVEKATRRRDELGDRAHQMYFASESQHAKYYAKTQPPPSTEKSKKAVAAGASAAAMARWGNHRDRVEAARRRITVEHGYIDLSLPALVRAERTARAVPTSAAERAANLKGPGLSTARRDAIHYYYSVVLGSPPPEDENGADLWGGVGGVNAEIRAQLWIPEGSSAIVKGVLEDCWEAHQTGEAYDADGRLRMRGRKAIIQEMSDEAYIIYRAKRIGMSLGDCTVLVNEFMRSNGGGASTPRVAARGSRACGSARPRWSPSLTTRSSRRPTRPLWARLLLARASRGGCDAGVRCGSAEAKIRLLFS